MRSVREGRGGLEGDGRKGEEKREEEGSGRTGAWF